VSASAAIAICSKSQWLPAIRREHALAKACVRAGIDVTFVEMSSDVRALRRGLEWIVPAPASVVPVAGAPTTARLTVRPRRTLVPGHRGGLAARLDAASVRLAVRRSVAGVPPDAVVVSAPWTWEGCRGLPAPTRRVLDLTDDWRALLPSRARLVTQWYRRIEDEADAIIVVAPALAGIFRRPVTVVPNAADERLLAGPPVPPPGARRMVYLGTLSERFDTALMAGVLRALPDWTLDLYGPRLYGPGGGDALDELLSTFPRRVREHGTIARSHVGSALDGADVAILPNDPAISAGQDSMKLYDYAARSRPIVATTAGVSETTPEHLFLASSAAEFARCVHDAFGLESAANRRWVQGHTWSDRLTPWLTAILGAPPAARLRPDHDTAEDVQCTL
jgi:hypothetical protein